MAEGSFEKLRMTEDGNAASSSGPPDAAPEPGGVLVIVVHYRSGAATRGLLTSLARQTLAARLRVAVVDNSGDVGLTAWPGLPGLVVLAPGENAGYFGGAAYALRALANGDAGAPAWVIVSNPDVTLPDAGTLEALASSTYPPGTLAVAPGLTDARGRALNPFLETRPSARSMRRKARLVFSNVWTLNAYALASMAWRRLRPARPSGAARAVYAPHGAFVILPYAYFARGGTLDPFAFLYLEEVLVAETVRRAGGTVRFDPALRVVHAGHVATGRVRLGAVGRHHAHAFAEATRRYFSDE